MSRAEELFKEAEARVLPQDHEFVRLSLAVGDRIRQIMAEEGITQKVLAERMGKTESEVSRWMCGLHNLTLRNIARINVALPSPAMDVTTTAHVRTTEVPKSMTENVLPFLPSWDFDGVRFDTKKTDARIVSETPYSNVA